MILRSLKILDIVIGVIYLSPNAFHGTNFLFVKNYPYSTEPNLIKFAILYVDICYYFNLVSIKGRLYCILFFLPTIILHFIWRISNSKLVWLNIHTRMILLNYLNNCQVDIITLGIRCFPFLNNSVNLIDLVKMRKEWSIDLP